MNLFESTQGFIVKTSEGKTSQIGSCESWDPKKELRRAINDLKIDEWGLEFDDFKPSLDGN
jgi:hypothetical protein